MSEPTVDPVRLQAVLARNPQSPASLIAVLQDIQREFHYLPPEALKAVAGYLGVPLSRVYSVATFYNAFSLIPKGKHVVRICVGTACHIRGAALIQDQIESELKIKPGETTEDGEYSLEVVACVGACAMAPVVIVNDKYHGGVKVTSAKKILKAE